MNTWCLTGFFRRISVVSKELKKLTNLISKIIRPTIVSQDEET